LTTNGQTHGHEVPNTWLSRYPRPVYVIHDQRSEFLGHDFQERLRVQHYQQSNNGEESSVCERMHQAIGNTLRVLSTLNPPQSAINADYMVVTTIADAVYATRYIYSSALKPTPDMILKNIPLVTDLQQLRKRRQEPVDQRLLIANAKRYARDYAIGDEVLKLVYQPDKLDPRAKGPYRINRVQWYGNHCDFPRSNGTYQHTSTQTVSAMTRFFSADFP
jgi:hypothetical protein